MSLVLDGCCYIFEQVSCIDASYLLICHLFLTFDILRLSYLQSAYAGVAPEPLFDTLLEAGFNESSAKVIGRFWASEAAAFIAKLKSRTLGSKALIDSSYHLNLIMSDSRLKTQHEPTAVFELNVSDGNVNDDEAINVEFNHSELYSFFSQLEHIQQQLDQLS